MGTHMRPLAHKGQPTSSNGITTHSGYLWYRTWSQTKLIKIPARVKTRA